MTIDTKGKSLRQVLSEIEDKMILDALKRFHGNRRQAAEALGIKRTALVMKLNKMGAPRGKNSCMTCGKRFGLCKCEPLELVEG